MYAINGILAKIYSIFEEKGCLTSKIKFVTLAQE